MEYNRIHPSFKSFILNDALKEWRRISKRKLTKEGKKLTGGMTGYCFTTSLAFQHTIKNDFSILCNI